MKNRYSCLWLIVSLAVVLILVAFAVARVLTQGSFPRLPCPPFCMVTFVTPSIYAPASVEQVQVKHLFDFILVSAAITFVLVEGMLFFAVFRFRNRPPEAAMQFHGNTKLELAWTAAPAVILAVLLGFTLQTMGQVRAVPSANALNVKAIGHQWWWEFRYPDLNIITANELYVPVNTDIEVSIESNDVEHGFWVPELFGKVDAVPGYTNRVRFTPNQIRSDYFGGQCTQFCGLEHAQMRFAVVVRSAADFQTWAAAQQQTPGAVTGDAAAGKAIFLQPAHGSLAGCITCHSIAGTTAAGVLAPNLTHIASRGFIAGGVLANTPADLTAWITNAQAVKPGNMMPDFHNDLTADQVSKIVAYLETLK